MKHIFVVHSNVSYLVALATIKYENIAEGNYIIISDSYQRDAPIKVYNQPYFLLGKKTLLKYPIDIFFPDKRLDSFISDFVGNDVFYAYVPCFLYISKVLVTNRRCAGFNFIEEGASNYAMPINWVNYSCYYSLNWRSHFSKTCWLEALRGNNAKMASIPLLYNAYVAAGRRNFYGLSEETFVGAATTKVSLNPIVPLFKDMYNGISSELTDSIVWVGGNYVEVGSCTMDDMRNMYVKYLKTFLESSGIRKLYVKFHPNEISRNRTVQLNVLSSLNIECLVIPDSVCLEICMLKAKNMTLCGLNSTLLLYASMMGHQSVSFCKYMPSTISSMWERINMINNVKFY